MKHVIIALLLMFSVVTALATVPPAPPSSATFTCTGSVGPYPFTFPITDPTAMTVIQNGTTLSSANYTIAPVNNNYNNGGNVTLSVVCPSGQSLLLQRITPQTQIVKFYDNMPIPMSTFEKGLDKLTEISQDISATGVMHWRGAWSATTIYTLNDAVSYNGSSYISLTYFNLNNIPSSAGTEWSLMVSGGSQFVGPISGVTVGYPVAAAGQFTVLNGVINPAVYTGSDIGAQINAAITAQSCGGSFGCLIQIPPEATYTFSTPIIVPQNTTIDCGSQTGWSSQQAASATAANLSYTGSGVGITLSAPQAIIRNCTYSLGSSTTKGIAFTAGQTMAKNVYIMGGGSSTHLVDINCGASGCEKPMLDSVDLWKYTGVGVYCANSNDTSFVNSVSGSAIPNSTSIALWIDSQCNGLKANHDDFSGSGLHQIEFSDTLSTGAPTWAEISMVDADCPRQGSAIYFAPSLGAGFIHARLDPIWAAGAGQDCSTGTVVTVAPGIEIDGGNGITIATGEIRANTGDGILINSSNVQNVIIANNQIWGNNYHPAGSDNGNYNGVTASAFGANLVVTGNTFGNSPAVVFGHQHYGVYLSAINPLMTVVAANTFNDNTVGSYYYINGYQYPTIYGNATINSGPTPLQRVLGDMGVYSLSGTGPSTHVIPNFASLTSNLGGLGINCYYDGTNWHFTSDGSSNGGTCIVGSQDGHGYFYVVPTNGTPASDQTIANGSLPTPAFSWNASGQFTFNQNVAVGGGANAVYRCATAGTLPVGALTINTANCGTTTDTGLRVK